MPTVSRRKPSQRVLVHAPSNRAPPTEHAAAGRPFEPRQHHQQAGLAGAGWDRRCPLPPRRRMSRSIPAEDVDRPGRGGHGQAKVAHVLTRGARAAGGRVVSMASSIWPLTAPLGDRWHCAILQCCCTPGRRTGSERSSCWCSATRWRRGYALAAAGPRSRPNWGTRMKADGLRRDRSWMAACPGRHHRRRQMPGWTGRWATSRTRCWSNSAATTRCAAPTRQGNGCQPDRHPGQAGARLHLPALLSGMEAPPNLGAAVPAGSSHGGVRNRLGQRPGLLFDPFFLDGVAG